MPAQSALTTSLLEAWAEQSLPAASVQHFAAQVVPGVGPNDRRRVRLKARGTTHSNQGN